MSKIAEYHSEADVLPRFVLSYSGNWVREMLRLIIDKLGSGHHDLFLKIDASPDCVRVADSYFLFDFFEVSDDDFQWLNLKDDETTKYKAALLLDYWVDRIRSIEKGQEKFVIFDLSDQYIGGLMLERVKRGFRTKFVWTDKIQGPGIGMSGLDQQIIDKNIKFLDSEPEPNEWLIGEEALFQGLAWSKGELEKEYGTH